MRSHPPEPVEPTPRLSEPGTATSAGPIQNALILSAAPDRPTDVLRESLIQRGWIIRTADGLDNVSGVLLPDGLDLVVVVAGRGQAPAEAKQRFHSLMQEVDARHAATLLVGGPGLRDCIGTASLADTLPAEASDDEILARLDTLRRFQEILRRSEAEVQGMQRMGKRLRKYFNEVDQEMQLAGRLQRDFLPRLNGPIGPVQFATLFRPASWVSGDIYDVFRVDEHHLGFYVADAVGHGMAAGLLTMFIKKAVVAKRIDAASYELMTPSRTLTDLNDALIGQELPNCQFVTACFCLLDTRTLELQYARGGHPYPYLIGRSGTITELKTTGGLLGVFKGAEFPSRTVTLKPGEKLILYTDGLEDMYSREHQGLHRNVLKGICGRPAGEIVAQLADNLDEQRGSLHPVDDVTAVVMEVLEVPAATHPHAALPRTRSTESGERRLAAVGMESLV